MVENILVNFFTLLIKNKFECILLSCFILLIIVYSQLPENRKISFLKYELNKEIMWDSSKNKFINKTEPGDKGYFLVIKNDNTTNVGMECYVSTETDLNLKRILLRNAGNGLTNFVSVNENGEVRKQHVKFSGIQIPQSQTQPLLVIADKNTLFKNSSVELNSKKINDGYIFRIEQIIFYCFFSIFVVMSAYVVIKGLLSDFFKDLKEEKQSEQKKVIHIIL